MRFGNLAVCLLLLEAASGLGLLFHYRPAIGVAYLDMIDLREISGFGFLRGLHRWGAYAAVIMVWLHLVRVALRGAYAPPRRRNWSVGVVLMLLTLLLAATGYLLPWDQEAYWGIALLTPAGEATLRDAAPTHLDGIQRLFGSYVGPDEVAAVRAGLGRVVEAACSEVERTG